MGDLQLAMEETRPAAEMGAEAQPEVPEVQQEPAVVRPWAMAETPEAVRAVVALVEARLAAASREETMTAGSVTEERIPAQGRESGRHLRDRMAEPTRSGRAACLPGSYDKIWAFFM